MKKLLFIYNPNAGKGKIKESIPRILEIFERHEYLVTQYKTKAPFDGKKEVERCGSEYDLIVCCGGDGTLSEIAFGVASLEKRPPIGFIPAGSTNDTAQSYHIPKDIEEAALVAVSGIPFKTDLGMLGERNFIYVASFGDISAVSAFTPQEAKRKFGHLAYIAEGMKTLPKMKYHNITVRYDDEEITGEFYLGMITNSFQVGGFKGITGGNVDLQDGCFEVLLLKKPMDILDFARQVNSILIRKDDGSLFVDHHFLQKEDVQYELVHKFKASEIDFICDEEVQWVVDGEDAGKHKKIKIKNINKAVEIMVKDC